MNKNIMGTLVLSLAMFVGMIIIFIVQTAVVHASLLIASCFAIVGFAGFMTIVACAVIIHREGGKA